MQSHSNVGQRRNWLSHPKLVPGMAKYVYSPIISEGFHDIWDNRLSPETILGIYEEGIMYNLVRYDLDVI